MKKKEPKKLECTEYNGGKKTLVLSLAAPSATGEFSASSRRRSREKEKQNRLQKFPP
jgi:hypothetical protein